MVSGFLRFDIPFYFMPFKDSLKCVVENVEVILNVTLDWLVLVNCLGLLGKISK